MITFTIQFTTSESKKIQSKLVKGTSKENALTKFFKKYRAESTSIIKVY